LIAVQVALPAALELASESCVELRETMPPGFLDHLGVVYSDRDDSDAQRAALIGKACSLVHLVMGHLPLDSAADQIGSTFIRDRLPPPDHGAASTRPVLPATIQAPQRLLRLKGHGFARMSVEDDAAVVYHCLANARHKHCEGGGGEAVDGHATGRLEFPIQCAELLEQLLYTSDSVDVEALPALTDCDLEVDDIITALCKEGILVTV
jgi:hypothetical protein